MSTSNSVSLWKRSGVRAFLSVLLLTAVALLIDPTPAATQPDQCVIGFSQRGQPLVVHHVSPVATARAMPAIIDELRRRGYELVTVGELIGP